ncbi:hypothetical protein M419DRAFT_75284 [Trichoderma reesei RUT C-30]|uniref:DUF676 domain-containing protein n=1 Tax=Hypocrea jecorina (strain ATCC 56765 / BCRC 32924 / NRRL 11460 / Rut C-30) TaxID=1344414 RepID=A0A024SGP3_HYPJR|nr:hypothetical protein M419DRAFT_75284 [Trichoderma reesei RUT C-30]
MSLSIKNETASIPEPRRGPKGGSTYRIRGVPLDWGKDQLQRHLELHEPDTQPTVKSLADEIDGNFKTATVNFLNPPSSEKTVRPWYIPLPETEESEFAVSSLPLRLDSGFIGMTTLFAPPVEDHEIDVIAVSGLGGHAYGSFKDKNGNYMWLQDALSSDLINVQTGRSMARIMIYGHKSTVPGSRSVQDIDDLATALHSNLLALVEGQRTRPIILMGHSLGGLIVKKTLITLSKSRSQEDQKLFRAIYGIVFFGVPHRGMDIASLIPMVGDGPNLPLIKSIGESSPALDLLQENFHPALGDQGQAEIICFYETAESPTAQQDKEGRWRMNGPPTVLVTKASAVHCRSWELDDIHVCPIARSHSEIVKFSPADSLYNDVQDRLLGLAQRAIGIQQRI